MVFLEFLDAIYLVLADAIVACLPDIPPAWLEKSEKNSPKQVVKIAEEIALLRRIPCSQVAEITTKNSMQILPKMAKLFTRPQVLH